MYDVIIIGKGAAGISAALYTTRANLKTLVIGSGIGALENAESIENYYGFPNGISGELLHTNGIEQAIALGCEVLEEEVISVVNLNAITVKTNRHEYECRALLIATGKPRSKPKINGMERLLGRGISLCAVCDGFFYKGRRLAVLGSANYAVAEAQELARFTRNITIFTNGIQPTWEAPPPEFVAVNTAVLQEIKGAERVEGLVLSSGEVYNVDGIFVAEGTATAFDFAVKLGVLTDGNNIVVDASFMTNVPDIYAAGDCIGGFLQISKAVGEGALAAYSMIKALTKKAQ